MLDEIELILSKTAKEVINTPLSLKLLKIYSILYLGGGQPRWCERSQTNYYNQLKINGLKKYKEMENTGALTKTCQLRGDIMIYVSAWAMHVTHTNITDQLACEGLTKGYLKETQFVKLPENWLNRNEEKQEPKKVIKSSYKK